MMEVLRSAKTVVGSSGKLHDKILHVQREGRGLHTQIGVAIEIQRPIVPHRGRSVRADHRFAMGHREVYKGHDLEGRRKTRLANLALRGRELAVSYKKVMDALLESRGAACAASCHDG